MANVAILRRRHVVRILHQVSTGIARQRQESTDVATFAAVADGIGEVKVDVRHKFWRRRKITRIGRKAVVAYITLSQGRNMADFLAYGTDSNMVGIAAVAGFAIVIDTAVREAGCQSESRIGVIVADETVLHRRQMGRQRLPAGDVTVVA